MRCGAEGGRVNHGQELDHPEKPLLVLVIRGRDAEHKIAVGLRGARPLLLAGIALVEPLVDHFFQDRSRPDTLPLVPDDQHVGRLFLDPASAQNPADLGIIRVFGIAGHDRPLSESEIGPRPRRSAGHKSLAKPGGHQVAAGQAPGAARRGHFHVNVEPVLRIGPGADCHLHDHHRELGVAQQLVGVLDPGLAHLVYELAALPGRRWIGAGVLESGHQPDAHDLDLTALKHISKVADGLLDLERRWLGLLCSRGCSIRLDLCQHQR